MPERFSAPFSFAEFPELHLVLVRLFVAIGCDNHQQREGYGRSQQFVCRTHGEGGSGTWRQI